MGRADVDGLHAEIKAAFSKWQVSTIDEANAVLADVMDRRNNAPIADFNGLTPAQMAALAYGPFKSPDIVEFPDILETEPSNAQAAHIFKLLVDGIGAKGIKATVTGNLPRNLCRSIAVQSMSPEEHAEFTSLGDIQSEVGYRELSVLRFIAQAAGLIRKVSGRFTVTKACQKSMAQFGMRSIYPKLLRTYAQKLSWDTDYGYLELPAIQNYFAYSLYLLHRFGDTPRPPSFYEDAFFTAFPQVVAGFEPRHYNGIKELRYYYTYRTLSYFAAYFGLVEITLKPGRYLRDIDTIRKTELFADAVRFHI